MQIRALQEINLIDQLLREAEPYLCADDVEYFNQYIERGLELYEQGAFTKENRFKLRDAKWDKFNFRYGASSIKGTRGELLALMILNKTFPTHEYVYGQGSKEDEMDGTDIWCTVSGTPIQVKSADDDVSIKIESSWRHYEGLNEFIIVDLEHNKLLHLHNYLTFKEEYKYTSHVSFQELLDQEQYECEVVTLEGILETT